MLLTRQQIREILSSIPDITSIRDNYGSDDRMMFQYQRESCVVHEPFGDNSRYWIGSAFPEQSTLDIEPIRAAFQDAPHFFIWIWRKFTRIWRAERPD